MRPHRIEPSSRPAEPHREGRRLVTVPSARFLIVNADDFGRNEAINLGVVKGFRRGIITSASLVATGPAFESAVASALQMPGLGVGIHLVVNEYVPVLPAAEIPGLLNSQGRFFSRPRQFMRMALNPRMQRDLLREWEAQISKIENAGIKITHIDGHGHCHAHPAAAGTVLRLAKRHGIVNVRLPAESIFWKTGPVNPARFIEKVVLWLAAQVPKILWKGKLQFPRSFYGFSDSGHMTADIIRQAAASAPLGVSELVVHVGLSNDEAEGFWTGYDYAGDLNAVTAQSKQQFEKDFAISLITHAGGGQDGFRGAA
jgi:hopanoid biosynthesis associated protein HpnK